MISSFDKAIVALVGLLLFAGNHLMGWDASLTTAQFDSIVSVLTTLGVYLVPNK